MLHKIFSLILFEQILTFVWLEFQNKDKRILKVYICFLEKRADLLKSGVSIG